MIRIRVMDEFWYQKSYYQWCKENCNGWWKSDGVKTSPNAKENWTQYKFKLESDAMAFKLVWGGNRV